MKLRTLLLFAIVLTAGFMGVSLLLDSQVHAQTQIRDTIVGGNLTPRIAVPDFRGAAAAQPLMNVFNETLWSDLEDSGAFEMAAKTFYPLDVPQSVNDFKAPTPASAGGPPVRRGPWMTDWSGGDTKANYLAFGYAAAQNGSFIIYGNMFNVGVQDVATAQVFPPKGYFASLDEAGARKNAHEYAADILKAIGAKTLAGSKITFVSDRTGQTEIWTMDYDGANQRQLTRYGQITKMPAVSPDGKRVAFATLGRTRDGKFPAWQIKVHSTENGGVISFYSPESSTITTPEFSPDGKKLWFMAVLPGSDRQQVVSADLDGRNLKSIINRDNESNLEARINPKNADDVIFVSSRAGLPQIFRMNANGTGARMISAGTGEALNPSWSPDGTQIAFAWTKGYDPGSYNVFVMDLASKETVQLTHQSRNENPSWAPDGKHIVFSSKRGKSTELYTMLANGTHVKQLTSAGNNVQPVWTKGIE